MLVETVPTTVTTTELGVVKALMTEGESTVSGAPLYQPEAAGLLLLLGLLLLSPKEPEEEE
ncbi:hypothetical protein ACFV4P_22345 [Kitasatospora sp. NPDC059795]|uniref:hypothetical protein n=1 Tax=unclassified Kitasatospora TaxID=2633591 RepID=UPI00093D566B|nr:hypothetical protein [Kitasatospora sp. CB01950]OKJ14079.1 hypothetical protein AMK19_10905 [Kitasatospora sp. CB01950]